MTNEFITSLKVTPLPDGVRWRLDSPLKYLDDSGALITVPTGFVTDFASIPPLATIGGIVELLGALAFFIAFGQSWDWILAPAGIVVALAWFVVMIADGMEHEGTYDEAAALHDWLYATRCRSFQRSNWILFRAMIAKGAGHTVIWKRVIIWLAVAVFGFIAWDSDARKPNGVDRTRLSTTAP